MGSSPHAGHGHRGDAKQDVSCERREAVGGQRARAAAVQQCAFQQQQHCCDLHARRGRAAVMGKEWVVS
jgi:hypothetical protein